jgi:GGDEF domain-containing protein
VARVRAALKLKSELERRQARERELLSFLSSWGDRRATLWIDEATGLFVGEIAEAYLMTGSKYQNDNVISILALALDRFDAFRSAHGEEASRNVLSDVAQAVRGIAAKVGIIAASYRNGLIVLVAPEVDPGAACQLGETLRNAVAKLKLRNGEAIAADHITASVSAVTGTVRRGPDRAHLLTHAIATVQQAAEAGGNRLLAVTV